MYCGALQCRVCTECAHPRRKLQYRMWGVLGVLWSVLFGCAMRLLCWCCPAAVLALLQAHVCSLWDSQKPQNSCLDLSHSLLCILALTQTELQALGIMAKARCVTEFPKPEAELKRRRLRLYTRRAAAYARAGVLHRAGRRRSTSPLSTTTQHFSTTQRHN